MFETLQEKFPYLFGKHYALERFGILLAVLCVSMIAVCGSIFGKREMDLDAQEAYQPLYTTQFAMSLSHAKGQVVSVNTSLDKTKCLVLLKYEDPTRMSTNAEDYELYLTGSDRNGNLRTLESNVTGGVYVFGNSGYVALYMVDVEGFKSQILDLVVRSYNDFREGEPIKDSRDTSFEQYDQARIYFNPGAAGAETVSCLEADKLSAYNIYESVLVESKEVSIHASMEDALKKMQQAQTRATAAEKTLLEKQIQIPSAPSHIAGDMITTNESGQLELVSANPLPGSHVFDWRNGSVREGYLDGVMMAAGYADASDYFAAKNKEQANANTNNRFDVQNIQWFKADGTEIYMSMSDSQMSTAEKLNNDAMRALSDAWSEFYNAKVEYQITLPAQLLDLEVMSRDMTSNYTVNLDCLIMYNTD